MRCYKAAASAIMIVGISFVNARLPWLFYGVAGTAVEDVKSTADERRHEAHSLGLSFGPVQWIGIVSNNGAADFRREVEGADR